MSPIHANNVSSLAYTRALGAYRAASPQAEAAPELPLDGVTISEQAKARPSRSAMAGASRLMALALCAGALLGAAGCASTGPMAGQHQQVSPYRQAGRDLHEAGQQGKEVGQALGRKGAEVGRDIGEQGKKIGLGVKDAAVEFWKGLKGE